MKNLMKRIISITFVTISIFVLLVFAILPHHHHKEKICEMLGACKQYSAVNYEHTDHKKIPKKRHNTYCISELRFVVPNFNNKIKSGALLCEYDYCNDIYIFDISFLTSDFFNFNTGNLCLNREQKEYICFYKHLDLAQFYGLRAPPAIFL